jgi:hypothetical protein
MEATQTKSATKRFAALNMRVSPDFLRSVQEAARAEGLAPSAWARRILTLVLAGSRKKKKAA